MVRHKCVDGLEIILGMVGIFIQKGEQTFLVPHLYHNIVYLLNCFEVIRETLNNYF